MQNTVIYQKLKLNFTKSGNPLMAICVKIDNEEISYVRIKIKYGNYSNYVTDYLLVKDVRNVTEYLLVEDVRKIQKRGMLICVVAIAVLLFMMLVGNAYFDIKRFKEIRKRKQKKLQVEKVKNSTIQI